MVREFPRRLDPAHPAPLEAVQRLRYAVTGKRRDITGLCLRQELDHVGGTDGLAAEPTFDAFQAERREHQQSWDERDEEP
jgi:hypothetical protein